VRYDSRWKGEADLLRCRIDVPEEAAAFKSRTPGLRVNAHRPHTEKVDQQTIVTGAEPGQTMPAAPNRCHHASRRSDSHCNLHIRYISATRNQAWLPSYHPVPNASRAVIFVVGGAQQIAAELPPKRGVNLSDDLIHACCLSFSPRVLRHILDPNASFMLKTLP
jgi:hypothetical protein